MLINLIELMGLVILASIIQANYKIPSPITLMSVIIIFSFFGIKPFEFEAKKFDTIVMATLPLLIGSDALKIKWIDLKTHWASLFWVAVISILLFIFLGVLVKDIVITNYSLNIASIVLLFCMVAATDPITVSAIFSNFKIPHKLKVLTEGESLFNDATALIVFSVALVALKSPESVTIKFIMMKTISVIMGALVIGLVSGFLTTITLKLSNEPLVEGTIILFFVYIAYLIAEHFHFSGILAVIITVVMANRIIQNIIDKEEEEIDIANKTRNFGLLTYALTTKENQKVVLKVFDFTSMFASALLFVSIATIVNINKIFLFKYEILMLFIASTIIRGLTMLKFAFVSNQVSFMQSIQKHWWAVLTFAGSKGALSILMVHLIPNSFEYKEMFEQVIIGNIILSTFFYSIILAIIFYKNKDKFEKEFTEEYNHH
jgi:CPA1 family monovalent cation:H+ antiporter